MKRFFVTSLICIVSSLILRADDHANYILFKNSINKHIQIKEYGTVEQKIGGADHFATSISDQIDLKNLREIYNSRITQDLDSAQLQFSRGNFEACVDLLLPLCKTRKENEAMRLLGRSYENLKMPLFAKKYYTTCIEKYQDPWSAFYLGYMVINTPQSNLGITTKQAIDYLLMGTAVTSDAYDELAKYNERLSRFADASSYYIKSQSRYAKIRLANLILEEKVTLENNVSEAVNYIKFASEENDLNSMYWYGLITYLGEYGVKADRKVGYRLVHQAAKQGHKEALSMLHKLQHP